MEPARSFPPQLAASSSFSFQVISEALEVFKADWKSWLGFTLTVLAPMALGYGLIFIGYLPLFLRAMGEGLRISEPQDWPIYTGQAVYSMSMLILTVGLLRMSYVKLDTGTVNWKDGWKVLDQLPGQILITVLFYVAWMGGLLLLILPGLVAWAGLWLSTVVYADPRNRPKGPLAAMRESWRLSKPNLLMSFVMIFAIFTAQSAGSSVAGIGFVVTAPIGALAAAMTKRRQEALLENLRSNLGAAQ
jgi:hypothetical protein